MRDNEERVREYNNYIMIVTKKKDIVQGKRDRLEERKTQRA